ncbi:hypothetical protein [Algoriphagus algorifonticola]|uniref:hypothetical protein n=1 Tax=Algoriphagus algorifonticola TaxID=2593007 RepID=UPI0011A6FA63|nr:hypothetical protein [Algoriphagus algorifonticola]
MKKLILGVTALLLSFSAFPIQHYVMKTEACENGGMYSACREFPGEFCPIMEQTFCGETPVIGN